MHSPRLQDYNTPMKTILVADDIHAALKTRWQHGPLQVQVDAILRAALLPTAPAEPLPKTGVDIPSKQIADVDPPPGRPTKTVEGFPPPPPVSAQGPATGPVCKRCGHAASKHWSKGCLAGCLCSEARYRV